MNRPEARDNAPRLAAALRERAAEHEADLPRIRARFDRLTAEEPHRAARRRHGNPLRMRLIGIPLGVVVAVATATIAAGVTLRIGERPGHPASQAAASPSPSYAIAGQQTASPGASAALHPAGTASTRDESSPSPSAGPLSAIGIVDSHSTQYWAQEDLTVTTTRALRALHVIVTISGGATVQSTGSWSTILSADLETEVSQTSSGLTYDITLKPGQTLQPAAYAFGFQFNRPAASHDLSLDTYTVSATAVQDSREVSASGKFAG